MGLPFEYSDVAGLRWNIVVLRSKLSALTRLPLNWTLHLLSYLILLPSPCKEHPPMFTMPLSAVSFGGRKITDSSRLFQGSIRCSVLFRSLVTPSNDPLTPIGLFHFHIPSTCTRSTPSTCTRSIPSRRALTPIIALSGLINSLLGNSVLQRHIVM